jgi:SlyX protein
MPDDLAARLEKLETLAAYQEQAIEDLNKTITEQWAEIAQLKRLCSDLGARLREVADNPALAEPPEPPPPHY